MSSENVTKEIARNLAIEKIKQTGLLKNGKPEAIVDELNELYNLFHDALKGKDIIK